MRFLGQERDSVRSKAIKRLRRLPEIEILNWSDQAVNSLHQSLDAYRRERDGAALEEARQAVSMLAGVVDILEARYRG